MKEFGNQLARAQKTAGSVSQLFARRVKRAGERYQERLSEVALQAQADVPASPIDFWRAWGEYGVDAAQRAVLFWDTLRQRGNQWLAHEQAGTPARGAARAAPARKGAARRTGRT
jgi:hypothetical protein